MLKKNRFITYIQLVFLAACRILGKIPEKDADSYGVYTQDRVSYGTNELKNQPNLGAYFSFKVNKGEQVRVKIGTSFVSIEKARKNFDTGIPHFDFESIRQNLKNNWNETLSKIEV